MLHRHNRIGRQECCCFSLLETCRAPLCTMKTQRSFLPGPFQLRGSLGPVSSAVAGTYPLPLEQPRAIPIALFWGNVKDGEHALETRFFMPGAVGFLRLPWDSYGVSSAQTLWIFLLKKNFCVCVYWSVLLLLRPDLIPWSWCHRQSCWHGCWGLNSESKPYSRLAQPLSWILKHESTAYYFTVLANYVPNLGQMP